MSIATLSPAHAARFAQLRAEPSTDAPRDPARLARIERTRVEMLAQGPAIAATLANEAPTLAALAARLAARPPSEVVIAGCGDSWFAGLAARHGFRSLLGVPATGVEADDYALYEADGAGPSTLVFGISAGGNTPAVMAALERARARGAFAVGITNTPGSPLHTGFDAGLLVHATRKGWPTQSTTACIALLLAAAAAIAEESGRTGARRRAQPLSEALARLPGQVDAVTGLAAAPMQRAGEALCAAPFVAFAGSGPFLASAAIGAAKIRELGPIQAVAWPLEELQHYRAQKPREPLVLLAADEASRPRALDAAIVGAAVGAPTLALLGTDDAELAGLVDRHLVIPPSHPLTAPILFSVPLHFFAHAWASARAERGLGGAV